MTSPFIIWLTFIKHAHCNGIGAYAQFSSGQFFFFPPLINRRHRSMRLVFFFPTATGGGTMLYTPADVSRLMSLTPIVNRVEPASKVFQNGHSAERSTLKVHVIPSLLEVAFPLTRRSCNSFFYLSLLWDFRCSFL